MINDNTPNVAPVAPSYNWQDHLHQNHHHQSHFNHIDPELIARRDENKKVDTDTHYTHVRLYGVHPTRYNGGKNLFDTDLIVQLDKPIAISDANTFLLLLKQFNTVQSHETYDNAGIWTTIRNTLLKRCYNIAVTYQMKCNQVGLTVGVKFLSIPDDDIDDIEETKDETK